MLHVLREWQGLAEAGVVGGASAREETAQRGWEHLSWEVTILVIIAFCGSQLHS